jgi:hypothetical protein
MYTITTELANARHAERLREADWSSFPGPSVTSYW